MTAWRIPFEPPPLLFRELHRLRILESEFFAEDQRIVEKRKLKPDPETSRLRSTPL